MRPYSLLALLFLLSMCSSNTEVYTSTYRKKYDNGKSIEVIREDWVTTWTGVFTHRNYGGSSNFQYSFTLKPDDYKWKGSTNQAPLELIFCGNETYVKATERFLQFDSLYSAGESKDTILYFKNIDDRYFFKWFGDQYFVPSDTIPGARGEACSPLPIPYLQ